MRAAAAGIIEAMHNLGCLHASRGNFGEALRCQPQTMVTHTPCICSPSCSCYGAH